MNALELSDRRGGVQCSRVRRAMATVVDACLRGGRGGSPTAVVDESALPGAFLTDEERRQVPALLGTSHAVFVSTAAPTAGVGGPAAPAVSLRFFTAEGELPACGHGTVAALAYLADRVGAEEYRATLQVSGRSFVGQAVRDGSRIHASYLAGHVDLREPASAELVLVLATLGVAASAFAPGACVATLGRSRLLVPVRSRAALDALAPDFGRLRDACDRLGYLGCYVHTVPTAEGRAAARMFAPSIGVPEDIANANSTTCLSARLARSGRFGAVTVDMGDSLGVPSTITVTAAAGRPGVPGPLVHVGGAATVGRVRAVVLDTVG